MRAQAARNGGLLQDRRLRAALLVAMGLAIGVALTNTLSVQPGQALRAGETQEPGETDHDVPVVAEKEEAYRAEISRLKAQVEELSLPAAGSGPPAAAQGSSWREARRLSQELPISGDSILDVAEAFQLTAKGGEPARKRWALQVPDEALVARDPSEAFPSESRLQGLYTEDKWFDNSWVARGVAFQAGSFLVTGDELPKMQGVSVKRVSSLPRCSVERTFRQPWYVVTPQTTGNVWHCQNDVLAPLYWAMHAMGDTERLEKPWQQWVAASLAARTGAGLSPQPVAPGKEDAYATTTQLFGRDVSTVVLGPPQAEGLGKFFLWLLGLLAPRQYHTVQALQAAAGTEPICMGSVHFGRPPRTFRPWFSGVLPYFGLDILPRMRMTTYAALDLLPQLTRPLRMPLKAVFIKRPQGGTRFLANEDLMTKVLAEVGVEVEAVSFERLSPADQIKKVASADVLIGVHGAGLGLCAYMRPNSVCARLGPSALPFWEVNLFHRWLLMADVALVEWEESCRPGASWQGTKKVDLLTSSTDAWRDVRAWAAEVVFTWAHRNGVLVSDVTGGGVRVAEVGGLH